MFGSRGRSLSFAIAAALMGTAGAGAFVQPAPIVQSVPGNAARKTIRSGSSAVQLAAWRYRGPGTTMAQQQRASRKAKNVKRHRAASRG